MFKNFKAKWNAMCESDRFKEAVFIGAALVVLSIAFGGNSIGCPDIGAVMR